MLNQPSLFTNTAQIPPKGLTTAKEQTQDPLEGLRRKERVREEAKELFAEPQPSEIWESKETGLQVTISHLTPGFIWYKMAAWNGPQATGEGRFMETMKRKGGLTNES